LEINLCSYETNLTTHSDLLKGSSPVGNIFREDRVSRERQAELDACKLVFENLIKQNESLKERLSLLHNDPSQSEHPPVANTRPVPVQQHHSKSTQDLIGRLRYRSEKLDTNIKMEMELAEFPTENALYCAEVNRYKEEDRRIGHLEATGEIS
jgi:hypothetical protein